MELDWSTFTLEIVNFLALVWILQRFLYQPVLATLRERRARVERTVDEARAAEARASALQTRFESRLAEWEQEKAAAHARFDAEMAAERIRQMEALSRDLAAERERSAVLDAHRQETLQRELAVQAGAQARAFATTLLTELASPALEARLVQVFLEQFSALPEDRLASLLAGQTAPERGVVASAFPLPKELRQAVSDAIGARLGTSVALKFVEDGALLAGLRISLGARQLDLSLAGELAFFAEAANRTS